VERGRDAEVAGGKVISFPHCKEEEEEEEEDFIYVSTLVGQLTSLASRQ
jgi:hypothetical protein